MKNLSKKLLSIILTVLTIFSMNIVSFASELDNSPNARYEPTDYDEQLLDILDDELIIELQTFINTKTANTPYISEDELNIEIMDYIEQKYASSPSTYSGSLPQYQSQLNSTEKKLFLSNPVKGKLVRIVNNRLVATDGTGRK